MNGNSYRDASMGMRHLFVAEILNIISVVFLFIAAVLAITSVGAAIFMDGAPAEITATISGIGIAAAVFAVIWITLVIISFIMEIVGLNKAGHDHVYFKYAFGLVFVGILLAIGAVIFGRNALVSDLFGTAVECVDVITMIFVVYGCISLLNEKGNAQMVYSGYTVVNLMILVNIISVVARIMPVFIPGPGLDMFFYGFYSLLSIVSGIMYLVFLKRASKALI